MATENYRVSFAPLHTDGGLVFVNPAEVVRLRPSHFGRIVTLDLSNGQSLVFRGTLQDLAKILRVDIWLEEA